VPGSVTVKMALTVEGADEGRNASEYWLNNVTWCVRSGALYVLLVKIYKYGTRVNDV
jgi:hypothetical protein